MLVAPSWVTSGWIVPGGGVAGIAGVESGKAAPLVGGPPGVELHTVVDELPTGDSGLWAAGLSSWRAGSGAVSSFGPAPRCAALAAIVRHAVANALRSSSVPPQR